MMHSLSDDACYVGPGGVDCSVVPGIWGWRCHVHVLLGYSAKWCHRQLLLGLGDAVGFELMEKYDD